MIRLIVKNSTFVKTKRIKQNSLSMKSRILILLLFLSSTFSLSAQTRLGTTPRIINRADNFYYELDSLFLGKEYSYQALLGFAMITRNAFGNCACLRSNYDYTSKNAELVYLVLNRNERVKSGKKNVTTYRCRISGETFLELSDLFTDAVFASIPGNTLSGADGVIYEFLSGDFFSAECWSPQLFSESNCARLVSLIERVEMAVRDNDSESIEELRPEINNLTEVFKELRVAIGNQ